MSNIYTTTLTVLESGFAKDDWQDGKLSTRDNFGTTPYSGTAIPTQGAEVQTRPEWSVTSGSPSASTGQVDFGAGNNTNQTIRSSFESNITGRWWFDFEVGSDPSTNTFRLRFLNDSANGEYYTIDLNHDQGLRTFYNDGSGANLIQQHESLNWGANRYTVEIRRDSNGNYEIYRDGTLKDTWTETFVPTSTDSVVFNNGYDASVNVYNYYHAPL